MEAVPARHHRHLPLTPLSFSFFVILFFFSPFRLLRPFSLTLLASVSPCDSISRNIFSLSADMRQPHHF